MDDPRKRMRDQDRERIGSPVVGLTRRQTVAVWNYQEIIDNALIHKGAIIDTQGSSSSIPVLYPVSSPDRQVPYN